MNATTPIGRALAATLVALCIGCAVRPDEPVAPPADAAPRTPAYDARLTTYAYPYPVATFPLASQGRNLELVYMDVAPRQPNGRTVVLLHGKNFSGAYWRRTIAALVDEGFRVVAPDQIGFGKSSKPETFQYSFHALASHTKALLDRLGVEKAAVVGHSMGGMLAVRFALLFPASVERLVLIDPIGLEDWQRVVPYVPVEEQWTRELRQTPETIRAYMRESYFHGDWRPEYDELTEIQAGWTRGSDFGLTAHVAALTTDMVFTQPVLHDFGRLAAPTLLIVGRLDRTALGKKDVPPAVAATLGDYPVLARAAARAIPGARLVELPDVGHVPQFEAFDAYFAALDSFLQ